MLANRTLLLVVNISRHIYYASNDTSNMSTLQKHRERCFLVIKTYTIQMSDRIFHRNSDNNGTYLGRLKERKTLKINQDSSQVLHGITRIASAQRQQ